MKTIPLCYFMMTGINSPMSHTMEWLDDITKPMYASGPAKMVLATPDICGHLLLEQPNDICVITQQEILLGDFCAAASCVTRKICYNETISYIEKEGINMHISTALQDEMLDEIVEEKIPVTLFLMNGFQLRGMILDHDDAVVVLEVESRQQIIYKHAVSTITPIRPLKALNK